ncbi:leucine-rich repeat protein, partial [Candidatus Poribacteria bacterium]|nr:leucine-rich repeat protein [Candidatus Poribacteria bacterium]
GQLKTSASLDYDTKNSYSVTVSVSDGYEGTDSIDVTINVTEFDDSDLSVALSSRTTKVSDAIVDAIDGVTSASDVKVGHLVNVTSLDLSHEEISSLTADDFDGLTYLTSLDLGYNSLSSLPSGLFDGLTALTSLNIQNNSLTSLPDDIFDDLTKLKTLILTGNDINTLQGDLITSLSSLSTLKLDHNDLSSLPAGFFATGRKITNVDVNWNTVRPLKIQVSLIKVADGQSKMTCPIGSPIDIQPQTTISSSGEAVDGETHNGLGWDSHAISAGATESGILDVQRKEGNLDAVTVTFDQINLTSDGAHSGYEYELVGNMSVQVLPLQVPLAPTNNMTLIPEETALLSNYPNPFNPETWIPYQLAKPADVSLTFYNTQGQVVRELALGQKPAGYYTDRVRAAYW